MTDIEQLAHMWRMCASNTTIEALIEKTAALIAFGDSDLDTYLWEHLLVVRAHTFHISQDHHTQKELIAFLERRLGE